MWPGGVVVASPLPNDGLGFLQAVEDLPVQKLVTQLAVKAFAVAILPGATRLDFPLYDLFLAEVVTKVCLVPPPLDQAAAMQ